jgi:hypothetical protein
VAEKCKEEAPPNLPERGGTGKKPFVIKTIKNAALMGGIFVFKTFNYAFSGSKPLSA